MLRGLSVSVEMNGDLILDIIDIMTRSLVVSGVQCTVTVTSVSTVSGSVTVQVRVCEVPSYSGPLGTLRATAGVGTALIDTHRMIRSRTFRVSTLTLTSDSDSDSISCRGAAIDCSR